MEIAVSVIIPFYNEEKTLPLALSSLLAQSFKQWEGILVDDGSTDSSFRVTARFDDPRFSRMRHSKRLGRGAARATAIGSARGKFVAMLDADDWIYPHRLQEQVRLLEGRHDLDLVSSRLAVIDGQENLLGIFPRFFDFADREVLINALPESLPFSFAASMYRAEAFRHFNYDPAFKSSEDYDFFSEAIVGKRILVQRKALYAYRKPLPVSSQEYREAAYYRWKALKKRLRAFPLRSRRFLANCILKAMIRGALYRICPSLLGLKRGWEVPGRDDQGSFTEARTTVLSGLGECPAPGHHWLRGPVYVSSLAEVEV